MAVNVAAASQMTCSALASVHEQNNSVVSSDYIDASASCSMIAYAAGDILKGASSAVLEKFRFHFPSMVMRPPLGRCRHVRPRLHLLSPARFGRVRTPL